MNRNEEQWMQRKLMKWYLLVQKNDWRISRELRKLTLNKTGSNPVHTQYNRLEIQSIITVLSCVAVRVLMKIDKIHFKMKEN